MKKRLLQVVGVLSMLAFLASATPAHADMLDDVMSTVKSLKAELSGLKSQLSASAALSTMSAESETETAATVSTEATVVPTLLKSIATGNASDVVNLQQILKDKGYYNDKVDGKFGPNTQRAVTQFQAMSSKASNTKANTVVKEDSKVTMKVNSDSFFKGLPAQMALYQDMLNNPGKYTENSIEVSQEQAKGNTMCVKNKWGIYNFYVLSEDKTGWVLDSSMGTTGEWAGVDESNKEWACNFWNMK